MLRGSFSRLVVVAALLAATVGQIGTSLYGGTAVNAQASASVPETAAYAPADSLAFLSINLDAESDQWAQASVLGDRLGQPFTPQDLVERLLGSAAGLGSAFDVSALLEGDLALVVTDPNVAGLLPSLDITDAVTDPGALVENGTAVDTSELNGFALIAVVPNPLTLAAAINLFMTSQAESDGVTLETTSYNDVNILSLPANAESGAPGIAAAVVDDAVIAATTAADLEPIIDLRAGAGESLADSATVQKVLAPLPADRLATGVVNGPALAIYVADDPDAAGTLSPFLSSLNAVSGFGISAQENGFQLDLRSATTDGTPVFGSNDNFDPKLIDQMPADTQVLIDGYDFGATGVLDSAAAILGNLFLGALGAMFVPGDFGDEPQASPVATPVPSLAESADSVYSTLAFLLGFNLDTDLVGLLDGEYAFGAWDIQGTDFANANAAFISETSDPDTVSSSLGTLIGFLGFGAGDAGVTTGTTRIGDSTVNSIDVASLGIPSPLTVGVVDGNVSIGLGTDGGTVAVEGSTDSLADDPGFIAVTSELPADHNAILYVNLGSLKSTIDESLSGTVYGEDGSIDFNAESLAIVGFQDGDMAGAQGLLYIPAE